ARARLQPHCEGRYLSDLLFSTCEFVLAARTASSRRPTREASRTLLLGHGRGVGRHDGVEDYSDADLNSGGLQLCVSKDSGYSLGDRQEAIHKVLPVDGCGIRNFQSDNFPA